jgi:hypothetical protein
MDIYVGRLHEYMMKKLGVWAFSFSLFLVLVPVASAKGRHTYVPPTPPPAPPTMTTTVQWGAYVDDTEKGFANFEASVGVKASTEAVFWGFGDSFPTDYAAGANGQNLLIFWEPNNSNFTYTSITNGSQDSYITAFAQQAKAYGQPVILVPFDEFNLGDAGDCPWASWGVGCNRNTAAQFIAAWQHIHNIFAATGATNVRFGLDYNNTSEPSNTTANFASFYPGDAYVDLVGEDCFNYGGQNFAQACSPALAQLKTITSKPQWIFSTASISPQAQFIKDLGASGYPFVWFSQGQFQLQDVTTFKTVI